MSRRTESILAVVVSTALVLATLAVISGVVPHPASASEQAQVIKAARDAIEVEGGVATFDGAWPKYGLNDQQQGQLRDKLTRELQRVFTGSALTAKLSLALGWVDAASKGNAPRVVEFHVDQFDAGPVSISGADATVSASYRTYFRHAQIDSQKQKDNTWGAWATYDATFSLKRMGNTWLVSGMESNETSENPDTSLETPRASAATVAPTTDKSQPMPIPVKP